MIISTRMKRATLFISSTTLILALLFWGAQASSQVCTGCEVSAQTIANADEQLHLTDSERTDAEARHLLGGKPIPAADSTNERMIHQHEWITWYDDDLRVPLWVVYELTKEDASAQRTRKDCFRKDPRLPKEASSFCEDYEEPVFDRGHMVPRSDLNRTVVAMINSFIFSNMAPQHDRFNRGPGWKIKFVPGPLLPMEFTLLQVQYLIRMVMVRETPIPKLASWRQAIGLPFPPISTRLCSMFVPAVSSIPSVLCYLT